MSPIVQAGHPSLRLRAAEVDPAQIASPEMQALVQRMTEAMRNAPGVGIAAPQLGKGLRVIVVEDRPELIAKLTPAEQLERERAPFPLTVLFNPVLEPVGTERATFFEGCLSVNGYVGLVDRALAVRVRGLDEAGVERTVELRGWPARIFQHELDHLDGKLYVERMHPRSFVNADEAKLRFAGKPIDEVRAALGL